MQKQQVEVLNGISWLGKVTTELASLEVAVEFVQTKPGYLFHLFPAFMLS